MTEPKRRGRPPKAKPCTECGQTVGHYDDCPVGMGVEPKWEVVHRMPDMNDAAQAYALRIWLKQSPDLSRHERLGRIAEALKAQGLSMEGVELP